MSLRFFVSFVMMFELSLVVFNCGIVCVFLCVFY